MKKLTIKTTEEKQIINITQQIEEILPKKQEGICHIHIKHTTAALTTANLDPGTDQDMLDAFNEMIPHLDYRHPHNPSHVPDHIWSSIIGNSVTIPFADGKLELGAWQNIVLIEFNGPRERSLVVNFLI